MFASWIGERRVELAVDSGYANETVARNLPSNIVLLGAMRPDAVLTALPEVPSKHNNGRPRVRGEVLPKPQALADDESQPWQQCVAHIYGETKTVHYKTLCAQWYQVCGVRLLRIVVVRVDTGRIRLRVYFCTDHSFAAILRCAQRVLSSVEVLDLLKPHKDLRETHRPPARATRRPSRRAHARRPRLAA